MSTLYIRPEAELDVFEASIWYENERDGLGEAFIGAVRRTLHRIESRPEEFPVVLKDIRRALVVASPSASSSSASRREARYLRSSICIAIRVHG